MKYRLPLFATLALTALAALAVGVFWQQRSAERPLDPVGTVNFAASLTFSAAPVWIAEDRGLFTRAGLVAKLRQTDTGKTGTELLLRGEADLATAAEYKAVSASFQHKDLRVLGTTAFVHSMKLLGLKERGIARLEDIAGKRVGVSLGTSSEYFFDRLLTLNGLGRDAVTWVDLQPQAMAEALATTTVDAALVWSPFKERVVERLPGRLVEFDGQPGQAFYYVVLARQDWLARDAKVAERVMLALKWAEEWMSSHPEQARSYMAAKFGVGAAEMAEYAENSRFHVGLPQSLLSAMEAERDWLVAQGVEGTPVLNSLDLVAAEPLAAVAPRAVTLVRSGAYGRE